MRCDDISIHSTARVETQKFFRKSSTITISIHSTARVETLHSLWACYIRERFQSTPPRGWRHNICQWRCRLHHFNPLHREGGDAKDFITFTDQLHISIHSTARVETWRREEVMPVFQSTPPRGWRPGGTEHLSAILGISIHSTARVETEHGRVRFGAIGFQSTPPRGWRRGGSSMLKTAR